MKISIAMATYNGARFLPEQLESFLVQTRQPDELIITDDCSTDQTETVVREFAKTAPFAVVFYRNDTNLGYCGNFNAALMKTSGDLVFLSDQDDVWFPEKIEYMLKVTESNPDALAVMNDAELTEGDLTPVGLTKLGQMKSAGMGIDSFVMGCCCAVRRELLDLCLPIPEGIRGHDNWLIAFADGLNSKVVDRKILQFYRRHESNESQFIANRTTKVTRFHAWKSKIKSLRDHGNNEFFEAQMLQDKLIVKRINKALETASGRSKELLKRMLLSFTKKIEHQKYRQELRQKALLTRVILSFKLFFGGSYKNSNGFKSFLRDIHG